MIQKRNGARNVAAAVLTVLMSSDVQAMINFSSWTTYVGLFMGWIMGFVQYGAVAGVNQCAPEVIYTLESAVLVVYEAPYIT